MHSMHSSAAVYSYNFDTLMVSNIEVVVKGLKNMGIFIIFCPYCSFIKIPVIIKHQEYFELAIEYLRDLKPFMQYSLYLKKKGSKSEEDTPHHEIGYAADR